MTFRFFQLKLFEQFEPSPKGDNLLIDFTDVDFFYEMKRISSPVLEYFTFSVFDQAYSGKYIKKSIIDSIDSDPAKFLAEFKNVENFVMSEANIDQYKENIESAYIKYISVDEATKYIDSLSSDQLKSSLPIVNSTLTHIFKEYSRKSNLVSKSISTAWHEP